jgi:hypothetical protein
MFNRILQITALTAVLGGWAYGDEFAVPPGLITGQPGETIGWGFSITNDTPYWMLVDSSQFCQPGQDPLFTTCTTTLGSPTPDTGYTDLIATNATVIDPFSTLTTPYDPTVPAGLGTYSIGSTVPIGSVDSGNIILTYIEFSGGSPLTTGTPVSGDIELSGAASVDVVPEPSAVLLELTAVGLLGIGRLFARKSLRGTGSSC